MWSTIAKYVPPLSTFIYAFMAFVIPWMVYRLNQYLHKYGDPPWKHNEEGASSSESDS